MNNLMRAGLARLRGEKLTWICAVCMALVGAAIALMTGGSDPTGFAIDRTFFVYVIPMELACAVFTSLFIGTDYNDGTIRNKLLIGHSRCAVYLSNLATCALAGLLFMVSYIVPMLAIGIPRLGFFEMAPASLAAMLAITVAMMLAVCAIFTLVAMLCQNKSSVAVVCILLFLALLFIGSWTNSRLQEPEFFDNFVVSVDGSVPASVQTPNPDYLRGAKREAFQFLLEFSPFGQALIFVNHDFVHIWQLPVYSAVVTLLTTAAGLYVFRKKDIR